MLEKWVATNLFITLRNQIPSKNCNTFSGASSFCCDGSLKFNVSVLKTVSIWGIESIGGSNLVPKFVQGWYNYNILKDLLGDGIFAVDGEKWRQQRKVSSHEFSTKVLRDFSSVIFRENAAKIADIMSEIATTNRTIDIQVSLHNFNSLQRRHSKFQQY